MEVVQSTKWYEGWEKEFPEEYVERIHKPSLHSIMDFFQTFLDGEAIDNTPKFKGRVLSAFPGHGKTTALKLWIKKSIESKYSFGGLIVFREKEQMKEVEEFASKVNRWAVLYVDSENVQQVRQHLSKYQFVLISQERLKNLTIDMDSSNEFLEWKGKKRVIIIDEAPIFADSAVFDLGDGLQWVDDCFGAAKKIFSSEQRIMIRSTIQIMLAKELLENNGHKTTPLKEHLDSHILLKTLTDFLYFVDAHAQHIANKDSWSSYKWFKRLCNEPEAGYIDTGFYLDDYSDHKKIICSDRIDYGKLDCSILILDGTATYTPLLYNEEYEIHELTNYTKYDRLKINQRVISTSARQRKSKTGFAVQEIIAKDIHTIRKQSKIHPFPLMNKYEVNQYVQLKVISKQDYKRYFDMNRGNGKSPINILNTTGKNHLADQHALYLTSMPNRSAIYYKVLAVSLYKNGDKPLNMSMDSKDKESQIKWFSDSRIDNLYNECLLSELIQIIHRSSIRNLNLPSRKKVHIFIATTFLHILERLVQMLGEEVGFEQYQLKSLSKFERALEIKVLNMARKIREKQISLPKTIGRIEDNTSLKNLVNKNWVDDEKRRITVSVFRQNGLSIYEEVNEEGKKRKIVSYL